MYINSTDRIDSGSRLIRQCPHSPCLWHFITGHICQFHKYYDTLQPITISRIIIANTKKMVIVSDRLYIATLSSENKT